MFYFPYILLYSMRTILTKTCREVKRLRTKVRELESSSGSQQTPQGTNSSQAESSSKQQQGQDQGQKQVEKIKRQNSESSNGTWIKSSAASSPVDISRLRLSSHASRNGLTVGSVFYGVTSLPYFLTRMSHFVRTKRHAQQLDIDFDLGIRSPNSPNFRGEDVFLYHEQESHFLDVFWQTFYFSYPIFNEGQIRSQFRALWGNTQPGMLRQASPLIDIVMALCVQLGNSLMIRHNLYPMMGSLGSSNNSPTSNGDSTPSLAGFQYYQRCQDALDQGLETPSLMTVQSYILSIVYLYQAGLLNRAQVVSGKAIMMAMMLRLQDEPPISDPEPVREISRRTWWSLYTLDAMLSVEIGRAPMINSANTTCAPPSDADDVAHWLSPHYSYDTSCATWLGYQTQTLRLLETVTNVRNVLYNKYDSLVGDGGFEVFINNPNAREECAHLLTDHLKELNAWVRQVPIKFQVARRDDGQPLSTDRSSIDFNSTTLLHSQRQRLLLELQYHQYCINLGQLFICFGKAGDMPTPVADSRASAALAHAMTFTSMVHQALTASETLNGVYQIFRWQKNAVFTMIGYSYTFPICGLLASVRTYIETGLAVMDMYRDVLPEAGPVVGMARLLADDVHGIVASFQGNNYTRTLSVASVPASLPGLAQTSSHASQSTTSSTPLTGATPITASTPMTMTGSAMGSSINPATMMSAAPGPMLCGDENLHKQEFGPLLINDGLLDMDFFHNMVNEERATSEPMDMLWASLDFNANANMDPWGGL